MYRDYYLPCYQSKDEQQGGQPDVSSDGKKQEKVLGLSNKEFCDYYKYKTGKILSTRTFRETYVEEWYNNGLIEETDSLIDTRQKIHYPIVLLSSSSSESLEPSKNHNSIYSNDLPKIKSLGVSAQSPIFLQPRPAFVQKDFKKIPKNWLELQILELLRWEFQKADEDNLSSLSEMYEQDSSVFGSVLQVYDEKGSKICICQFYDKYNQTWSLNAYFSKGISYEKPEKYNDPLKYFNGHSAKECKIMGVLLQAPNSFISDFSRVNLVNQYYSYLITRTRALPDLHDPDTYMHTTESLKEQDKSLSERNSELVDTPIQTTADPVCRPDHPLGSLDSAASECQHLPLGTHPTRDKEATAVMKCPFQDWQLYTDDEQEFYSEHLDNHPESKNAAKEAFDFLGLDSFEGEIKYSHLIKTEDMPSLGKTAYRCKEHPDIWDTSLRGLEISHFEPFHRDKQQK